MADAGAADAGAPSPTPAPPPYDPGAVPAPRLPGPAPACARCGCPARRPRECEHTGWAAYCTECYVELHYRLTEPAAGADAG